MGLMLLLVGIPIIVVAAACGLTLKERLGWPWYIALCVLSAAPGLFLLGAFAWKPDFWGSAAMQVGLSAVIFVPVAALAVLMLLIALAEEALRRLRASRADAA